MKTLLFSGLISIATIGQQQAHEMNRELKHHDPHKKEWLDITAREAKVKQQIAFYQWKIDMLWHQYELVSDRMQHTKGNISELQEDRDYFLHAYEQNIQGGVALKESKKSIARLERQFKKDMAMRKQVELLNKNRLRVLLERDLQLERRNFNRMKKRNEKFVNAELVARLQMIDEYFAVSEKRIKQLEKNKTIRLAADMD